MSFSSKQERIPKQEGYRAKKSIYIAWDDNDVSTTSNFENEEQSHTSLMVSHHFDYDKISNFNSSNKPYYDELQDSFNDLHDKCLKIYRLYAKQKKSITFQ